MRIIIRIDTENAAFFPDEEPETTRILHSLAGRFLTDQYIYDINGNKCGTVTRLFEGQKYER